MTAQNTLDSLSPKAAPPSSPVFVKLVGFEEAASSIASHNPFDQRSFSNEPIREKLIRYRDYFQNKQVKREVQSKLMASISSAATVSVSPDFKSDAIP